VKFRTDFSTGANVLETPAAAQCALGALRDGGEMRIEWTRDFSMGFENSILDVRPNRVVFFNSRSLFDLSGERCWGSHDRLQDPSYFDVCLTETKVEAILQCFRNAAAQTCQ
jgi:hypothetical protein